jgi:hypothetical protein
MKKYIAALCAVAMLAGCSSSTTAAPATSAAASTAAAAASTAAAAASTGSLKVGIGSSTEVSAKDATASDDGSVQVSTTYASVALDGDTVKYVYFDIAQNKETFSAAGAVTSDLTAATPTKKEKGDDYGMKKASAIGKEWYEQAAALEQWAVGKTVSDFVNMATTTNDEGSKIADDADLKTGCTIGVDSFIEAFQKAADNAKEVSGVVKVGTGSKTTMEAADATASDSGKVESSVTYAVVALDKDGKILFTQDDIAQDSVKFTAAGAIDGDAVASKTKTELGDDYGMKAVSSKIGIGKEWYEQNEGFEAWTVGKTADEISGMATSTNDEGKVVTDDADLKTTTTIGISDFQAAVVTAINNAVEVK